MIQSPYRNTSNKRYKSPVCILRANSFFLFFYFEKIFKNRSNLPFEFLANGALDFS